MPELPGPRSPEIILRTAAREARRLDRQSLVGVASSLIVHGAVLGTCWMALPHATLRLPPAEAGRTSIALVASLAPPGERGEPPALVIKTLPAEPPVANPGAQGTVADAPHKQHVLPQPLPATARAESAASHDGAGPLLASVSQATTLEAVKVVEMTMVPAPVPRPVAPLARRVHSAADAAHVARQVAAVPIGPGAAGAAAADRSATAGSGGSTEGRPQLVFNPPPPYPPDALAQRLTGRVVVRAAVDAAGRVQSVRIERSSGVPSFDQAALLAVRGWRFRHSGTPAAGVVQVNVPVNFRLSE